MRALRSTLHLHNITINCVTPAVTITPLMPRQYLEPIVAAGLPASSPEHVGLAIVYSVTARQNRQVESYGKDSNENTPGRWNGRTIFTLGDTYTELEESIASLRPQWFGQENTQLTRLQQIITDFRQI